MERKYNLAMYPSETIIELIKSMKINLDKEIGWFHSKNSVAHITICNFMATDEDMNPIKNQLQHVCDSIIPFEVNLNGFGSFPNGAFIITADEKSKSTLIPLMTQFHESLYPRELEISTDPHVSIARRLRPQKLTTAKTLYTEINETFLCDHVVLRQFDDKVKQYFVTDTFTFQSNRNV